MKNNIIYNSVLNFTNTSVDSSNINWDIGIEDNIYTFTSKINKSTYIRYLHDHHTEITQNVEQQKRRFMLDYVSNY